ncbi:MAG: hypothetical protein ABIH09_02105 [Candidatus Omnitrophota bacterium]
MAKIFLFKTDDGKYLGWGPNEGADQELVNFAIESLDYFSKDNSDGYYSKKNMMADSLFSIRMPNGKCCCIAGRLTENLNDHSEFSITKLI